MHVYEKMCSYRTYVSKCVCVCVCGFRTDDDSVNSNHWLVCFVFSQYFRGISSLSLKRFS